MYNGHENFISYTKQSVTCGKEVSVGGEIYNSMNWATPLFILCSSTGTLHPSTGYGSDIVMLDH